MGIAMMEPSLPIWMYDTMNADELQQGQYKKVYDYVSIKNQILNLCRLHLSCAKLVVDFDEIL